MSRPAKTWRGIELHAPCALDLYCGGGGAGRGLLDAGFRTVIGVDREKHRTSYEHRDGMRFVQLDVSELKPEDLAAFDFVWASPPCQAFTGLIPKRQREQHEERWKAEGRHIDMIPFTRDLLRKSGKPYIIENVIGSPLENPVRLCGTMFGLSVFRHRLFESNCDLKVDKQCEHANCSTGSLMSHVRQPRTERYTDGAETRDIPAGFEPERVAYPCRNQERVDYVYRATTAENKTLLRRLYKRTYARSLKELFRATGDLVPMTSDEHKEEVERASKARKSALRPGEKQMFPVYGASTKSRGTTEEWREALGCPWMTREELAQAIPPAYSRYLAAQVMGRFPASDLAPA